MTDLTNRSLIVGGVPTLPPVKLTYRQACLRWPNLVLLNRERDPTTGRFKALSAGNGMSAVELRSRYEQPKFGIAGLNITET